MLSSILRLLSSHVPPTSLSLSLSVYIQADPPDFSKIPPEDIQTTVILLTCAYKGQEFIRVGYYVNNEYTDEALREDPPDNPIVDKLMRNILADKPRVTKFPINWGNEVAGGDGGDGGGDNEQQEQEQQEEEEEDAMMETE